MTLFSKKTATPAGEPFVWFTGLGLTLALVMVAGLVGIILVNGFSVFVPKRVAVLTLKEGARLPSPGKTFAAETADTRKRHDSDGALERLCHLGNKDLYGQSYAYVAESDIAAETFPEGIVAAERVENGNAYFTPVSLKLPDGSELKAADAGFDARLDELIRTGNARRKTILHMERDEIGDINRDISSLERILTHKAPGPEKIAEIKEKIARKKTEYAALAARASALREEEGRASLTYRTVEGREVVTPTAKLIHLWKPNTMGFVERAGMLIARVWAFVSDEPREANTEGGVFPAIFGTLVMTIFMSALVTPFGVMAAIYLREYAKQGLILRWVRISVNNLAGVPSIVFGSFGLGFFVYTLGKPIDRIFFDVRAGDQPVFGTGGLLWSSLTLALMTLPVVIVATEEALAAVPRGVREASLALGASKWQTIKGVVLPAAAPGVLTGVILAMARGAGEVAPLMLVGVVKLAPDMPFDAVAPFLHLDRKFMHLGFHIFDVGFQSPDSDAARPMVFATTLLLIIIVLVLNLGAIVLRNRLKNKYKVGAF